MQRLHHVLFAVLVPLGVAACLEDTPAAPDPDSAPGGLEVLFKVPVERADNAFVPATDGQRLYADVDRRIEAFDLATGAKLWSYQRPLGGPSSLVARDGRVFWAGDTAVALDAPTGRELWRYDKLDSPAGLGESDGDSEAYYVGTRNHRVHALRATDGALLWSRDLGPDWPYGGVVRGMTVSGDTVYAAVEHVAPCGKRLLVQDLGLSVIDLADGRFLGSAYNTHTHEALHTDFVVIGNRAYVFGRRDLYAFRCPT